MCLVILYFVLHLIYAEVHGQPEQLQKIIIVRFFERKHNSDNTLSTSEKNDSFYLLFEFYSLDDSFLQKSNPQFLLVNIFY